MSICDKEGERYFDTILGPTMCMLEVGDDGRTNEVTGGCSGEKAEAEALLEI